MANQFLGDATQDGTDAATLAAAQAASSALIDDANYCGTVGVNGSATNAAVHAFKVAFNASLADPPSAYSGSPLAYNGQYDQACADALAQVIGGSVQAACAAPAPPAPPGPGPSPTPPGPGPGPIVPANGGGMPKWAKVLLSVIVVLGIASLGYVLFVKPKKGKSFASEGKPRKARRRK